MENAYIYAFKNICRHTCKKYKLEKKLQKAEKYLIDCNLKSMIIQETLDKNIKENFDLNAIAYYLWKRDLEYGRITKNAYRGVRLEEESQLISPDPDILDYLNRINDILYFASINFEENIRYSV